MVVEIWHEDIPSLYRWRWRDAYVRNLTTWLMAKPTDTGGFFQSIWGNIKEILLWLEFLVDQIGAQIILIQTIKDLVKADLQSIADELKGMVEDEQNFVERVKHIRVHVIRADKVFQLWEDIRSGELKTFFTDQITPLQDTIIGVIDRTLQSGQQVGALKTVGPGGAIIEFIHKIAVAWGQVLVITGILKGVIPILQAIRKKLSEFESIILQQGNPRMRLKGTISARSGKLHGSA